MEYDEDRELTRYVWNHFHRFMTEFELRIGGAILGREKAAATASPGLADWIRRNWGGAGLPEVESALADGSDAFRRRVRDRLLAERGPEISINRCPSCGFVARTPLARQCVWCGFDWH